MSDVSAGSGSKVQGPGSRVRHAIRFALLPPQSLQTSQRDSAATRGSGSFASSAMREDQHSKCGSGFATAESATICRRKNSTNCGRCLIARPVH